MNLKRIAKRTIHSLGYDLKRFDPASSETARLMRMFSAHSVNLIFDVGANRGDFGRWLRDAGYGGRIVSFEPLAAPWAELSKAAAGDPLWEVAPRGAIGAEDGEAEMNVSKNLFSSSVLSIRDECVAVASEAAYVGRETVPLRRLDTIGEPYVRKDSVLLIKADVQGFEREVLRGAQGLLKSAAGLLLELSLAPLYDGQCDYNELISELKAQGFDMWDISSELVDPRSGRMLQANATFFRSS
jgi:FkbM family methyltransferase